MSNILPRSDAAQVESPISATSPDVTKLLIAWGQGDNAALERPAEERSAFLAEACKDETLRREVVALLEQPSMPEFLGGPAIAVAAAMVDEVHVSQWAGRRIGVYHLQTLLGKGGMGEVYLARDTRLGRGPVVMGTRCREQDFTPGELSG